jgi:hypothetical protein
MSPKGKKAWLAAENHFGKFPEIAHFLTSLSTPLPGLIL